jgi:hypothetical protein
LADQRAHHHLPGSDSHMGVSGAAVEQRTTSARPPAGQREALGL